MVSLFPVRRLLSGHLGSSVSALVDGQLDEQSTERAWQHVLSCPPCRRLVEHEGWVKRQLSQIADGPRVEAPQPSDQLVGSLLELDPAAVAWADSQEIEDAGRTRRRVGLVLVGAGSVSAAVFGLSTISGSPLGLGGGSPATSLGGSHVTPTRAPASPAIGAPGRLRGWTLGSGDSSVAHAHAVGNRP